MRRNNWRAEHQRAWYHTLRSHTKGSCQRAAEPETWAGYILTKPASSPTNLPLLFLEASACFTAFSFTRFWCRKLLRCCFRLMVRCFKSCLRPKLQTMVCFCGQKWPICLIPSGSTRGGPHPTLGIGISRKTLDQILEEKKEQIQSDL